MEVIEDIDKKEINFVAKDWRKFLEELRENLQRAYDFSKVSEESYEYQEDKKLSILIKCEKFFDEHTKGIFEIFLSVEIFEDGSKLKCSVKANLFTEYPEKTAFQRSITYYLLRSLWEKFYYAELRGKWKAKSSEILNRLYQDIISISKVV